MPTPEVVCSKCNRPAPGRTRCMYCGAPTKEVHTMVVGPDVADPKGAIFAKMEQMRQGTLTPAQREAAFEKVKKKIILLLDAGKLEECLLAYDEALAINTDPYLLLAKGQLLKLVGRPQPAVAALDQALAINPKLVDAWFEKADILETVNRYPQSLEAYDQAIALSPKHKQAYCDRAHVLGKLGRVPEALASCEAAIAIDPNMVHAWFNKGGAEAALGQKAKAIASFERFIMLAPPEMRPQADAARQMIAKLKG